MTFPIATINEREKKWQIIGKKNRIVLSTQKETSVILSEFFEWNLRARVPFVGAGTGARETLLCDYNQCLAGRMA